MDDEELLDALLTALNVLDPPPERLRRAALDAQSWRLSDAVLERTELGDLELAGAGMRGQHDVVDMTFRTASTECNISVERSDPKFLVSGMVEPVPTRIVAQVPGRPPLHVDCDEFGRFEFEVEGALGVAVSFVGEDETVVRTPLIDLV